MLQLFRVRLSLQDETEVLVLAEDEDDAKAYVVDAGDDWFEHRDSYISVDGVDSIERSSDLSSDDLTDRPYFTDAAKEIIEAEEQKLAEEDESIVWRSDCAEIVEEIRQRAENVRLNAEAEARQVKLPLDTVG